MHDPAAGAGHQVADERGEGVDAALLGVADVDGLSVVALHESTSPASKLDTYWKDRVCSPVDCDRLVLQHLNNTFAFLN